MEALRRCFQRPPPAGGGAVSYSRYRDPPEEEEEEEGGWRVGEGLDPQVQLPPPPRRRQPLRPSPRRLRPLLPLLLGSGSAFLAGLLVAALGQTPPSCGGELQGVGPEPPEEGGGWGAEAPPPGPLRAPPLGELLRRHLSEERVEGWVRKVSAGSHGAGSPRGRALAQEVLNGLAGAGLSRAWSRPQTLPLPTRGEVSLQWVDEGGREVERLPLDPEAFCAWSPPGNITGGLVYGHYGRPQDLALLRARGVPIRGNLLLLRLGRGDPPAKVAAAAGEGALGVLLYPDPQDTGGGPGSSPSLRGDTAVTLNLQEGAGDPFSRGFPSFSGWAPPTSHPPPPGLPPIPCHPLSASSAQQLLRVLGGPRPPPHWGLPPPRGLLFRGGSGGGRWLRLQVGGRTSPGTLTSVFGALEGRLEPGCSIVVGARRDSLGPGAAAAGVGTGLLLELARLFAAISKDGFQLRRTLLFVSWDGAEFGHLGATEWLEGYPNLLHTKVAAYLSLDQAVLGDDRFIAKSSPLLVPLLEEALSQVESPNEGGKTLLEQLGRGWERQGIRPLTPESGAFPFTAVAGVPALEIGFEEARGGWSRAALGTPEDTLGRLQGGLQGRLPAVARALAEVAAHLLLRLGHDPRLPLDPEALGDELLRRLAPLQARGLSLQPLSSARGEVVRAAEALRREMGASAATDERLNRLLNSRLMAAEASLLSPFVTPLVTPFRHILLARGGHSLPALVATLSSGPEITHGVTDGVTDGIAGANEVTGDPPLRLRVALMALTLRGVASALAGDLRDPSDPRVRGVAGGYWGGAGGYLDGDGSYQGGTGGYLRNAGGYLGDTGVYQGDSRDYLDTGGYLRHGGGYLGDAEGYQGGTGGYPRDAGDHLGDPGDHLEDGGGHLGGSGGHLEDLGDHQDASAYLRDIGGHW